MTEQMELLDETFSDLTSCQYDLSVTAVLSDEHDIIIYVRIFDHKNNKSSTSIVKFKHGERVGWDVEADYINPAATCIIIRMLLDCCGYIRKKHKSKSQNNNMGFNDIFASMNLDKGLLSDKFKDSVVKCLKTHQS